MFATQTVLERLEYKIYIFRYKPRLFLPNPPSQTGIEVSLRKSIRKSRHLQRLKLNGHLFYRKPLTIYKDGCWPSCVQGGFYACLGP